ncbi:hypothetical protein [Thermoactinomyces mirandus]|uniref:Uncharacterized protein n=1 Tax=Thermoactinomyces mirandus TaxID=2756294 RepID=A0A7W2ASS7_9BACL|nr:hypothetical protein [Thermoactinomyces mirandus]MBA4602796.1 hypothetical protein [Thermoactinomyces mirandus]
MGSKQSLVLLCCISLFLVAAPRLPYFDGGKETLFSLLWLAGIVLHLVANMRQMKMMFLVQRKKAMQQRFRMVKMNEVVKHRKKQWQKA